MAGEQILMVEDNAKNMTLLRDVLRATGYRTLEASTGGEALTLATERGPALVLMDIRLPDMDGVEALSRLRSGRPDRIHPGARNYRRGHGTRSGAVPGTRASMAISRSRSTSMSSS